jgi:hypothetical protein
MRTSFMFCPITQTSAHKFLFSWLYTGQNVGSYNYRRHVRTRMATALLRVGYMQSYKRSSYQNKIPRIKQLHCHLYVPSFVCVFRVIEFSKYSNSWYWYCFMKLMYIWNLCLSLVGHNHFHSHLSGSESWPIMKLKESYILSNSLFITIQ